MVGSTNWHPVCLASDLLKLPRAFSLGGKQLVVFRGKSGQPVVLEDRCIHRNMRLSLGKVCAGALKCPFHGWQYHADGVVLDSDGKQAGSNTARYQAAEYSGVIWTKSGMNESALPCLESSDVQLVAVTRSSASVPIELMLDIFLEAEHTTTTHSIFGYDERRVTELKCDIEIDDARIRVTNEGPPKRLLWPLSLLLGFKGKDLFVDEFEAEFDPLRICYNHYTRRSKDDSLALLTKMHMYFRPETESSSEVFAFLCMSKKHLYSSALLRPIVSYIGKMIVDSELQADMDMLDHLMVKDIDAAPMVGGRFDHAMHAQRRLLKKHYYGGHRERSQHTSTQSSTAPVKGSRR